MDMYYASVPRSRLSDIMGFLRDLQGSTLRK